MGAKLRRDAAAVNVTVTNSPTRTTVRLTGDVNKLDGAELLSRLLSLIESDAPPVVVVLDAVEFIEPTGVGTLLWAHRRAALVGSTFTIANPSSAVLERIAELNLHQELHVVEEPGHQS